MLYEYTITGSDPDDFDDYTVEITNWVEDLRQNHDFINEAIACKSYQKPEEWFTLTYEISVTDEIINDNEICKLLSEHTLMDIRKSKQNITFIYNHNNRTPIIEIHDGRNLDDDSSKFVLVRFVSDKKIFANFQRIAYCVEIVQIINEHLIRAIIKNDDNTFVEFHDSHEQMSLTEEEQNKISCDDYITEYNFVDGTWH